MGKLRKKPLRERIALFGMAVGLAITMALPLFTPFLSQHASADDGASNVLNMLFGRTADPTTTPTTGIDDWNNKTRFVGAWSHIVACDFHFVQRQLDDEIISRALGQNFDKFSERVTGKSDDDLKIAFFNLFGPKTLASFGDPDNSGTGTINEAVGLNYIHYLRDNIGRPVNIIVSGTPQAGMGNAEKCGPPAPGTPDPHFILIPVQANGDDVTTAIGRQVDVEPLACLKCGPRQVQRGGVMRFVKTGLTADGKNTTGTLAYYNNDQRKYGVNNVVVGGIAGLLNTGGWGAAANATFQDIAHINITYNFGGKQFDEQYTDFKWDSIYAYFLTSSNEPGRESLTIDNVRQDKGINPLDPASRGNSRVPFIYANFCPNSFKSLGYNLSYNDNGQSGQLTGPQIIQRVQQGINGLAHCNGVDFYDYTATGAVTKPGAPTNGLPTPENLQPGNLNNTGIWFYSNGGDGLVTVFPTGDGHEVLYTGNYGQNTATTNPVFYDHNASDCTYLGRVHTTGGPIVAADGDNVIPVVWSLFQEKKACQVQYGDLNVYALVDTDLYNGESQLVDSTAPPATPGEAQLVCDIVKISLSWLICPLAQAAISLAGSFDSAINDMLNISVNTFLNEQGNCASGNPGPCFYAAWNSMRVIAMAVIVAASLVMVISQALGLEVMSAYSIKKALPRLLMAVIFIALSWQLMKAAITFSDVLGYGVRALIYKPFSALGAAHIGAGTSDALAVLGGAAFIGLGALGLLSFAVTALLAVAVGFILLVFREMAVIFLTILTPAFVALSILPGTRKVSKIGLDSISGALLMFPIVAGFIAIGHTFAQVANSVNNGNGNSGFSGVVGQFVFIIAYFAPYFLIPLAFRLAGGLVATVGGVVNDRSKGAFDRLKNFRANRLKTNMEKMGEGRRFSDNTRLGRAFNTSTRTASTFANAESKWDFLTDQNVRNAAFQQHNDMVAAKHAQTARAQATKEDDAQHWAMSYRNEAEARANMGADFGADAAAIEAGIAATKASGGWGVARQSYALRRLAASGTGFRNLEDMHQAVYRVAGTNRAQASALLGEMNAVAGNVGRTADLKSGYGVQMRLYDQMVATGGAVGLDEFDDARVQAGKDANSIDIIRSKKGSVQNLGQATARVFRRREIQRDAGIDEAAARQDLDELKGMIESVEVAYNYGSTTNSGVANATMVAPTSGAGTSWATPGGPEGRRRIQMEASPVPLTVNPTTDRVEVEFVPATYLATDSRIGAPNPMGGAPIAAGDIIYDANGNAQQLRDVRTGRPVTATTPAATDPVARRSYNNQRVFGPSGPPSDPYNNGLA